MVGEPGAGAAGVRVQVSRTQSQQWDIFNRLQRALRNRGSGPSPEEHPRDGPIGTRSERARIINVVLSNPLVLVPDFLALLLSSLHSVSPITALFLSLLSCSEKKRAAGATVSWWQ